MPADKGKLGVFNRVEFGLPLRRRAVSIPPGRKIEVQLSPLHAIGEPGVTNFEDSRMAFDHAEKYTLTSDGGMRLRSVVFKGARPACTPSVWIGLYTSTKLIFATT